MRISKRCEYALRIMVDLGLAQAGGREYLSASELGAHEKIPQKFLKLILHELRKEDFVHSRRGKAGGYALSPRGRQAPVGTIVRNTHGPLAPIACVSETAYAPCSCPDEEHCGLRMIMIDVRSAVTRILDRHSVGDLVEITLMKFRRDRRAIPFALSKP